MWNPFGPPSLDGFVKLLFNELAKAGKPTNYAYDPNEQSLTRGNTKMSLAGVYSTYCHASRALRPAILNNYLAAMVATESPEGVPLEEVRDQIVAGVREEAMLTSAGFFVNSDQPTAMTGPAREPLSRWFVRTLIIDHPGHMALVSNDQLKRWNLTFDEAFAIGLERLRQGTTPAFAEKGGVYTGTWKDDYDSSRILVPGLFDDLPIEGDPIVVLPNRLTLLVADSAKPESVRRMLARAEEIVRSEPRPHNPAPLRLHDGQIEDYVVSADSPIFQAVQRAHGLAALMYYQDQQQLLESYYEKVGKDYHVAKFTLNQRDDGTYFSSTVWTKDVSALVPEADFVTLVDLDRPEGKRVLGIVPWGTAKAVMAAQMLDTRMFPTRYFVSTFPSAGQMREMGLGETTATGT